MFAVINKNNRKFFAGFNASGKATWTAGKTKAKAMTEQAAKGQAALFIAMGVSVLRKPVAL